VLGARPRPWSLYVVRLPNGALYTGITTDVTRRLAEHEAGTGKGAKSLRRRGPLALELRRRIGPHGLALRVEHRIKRLPKTAKEALLADRRVLTRLVRALRRTGAK
jgi:putative endonuclease